MGTITRGIANNILGNGAVDGTDALSGTIPANNIANASLDNLTTFPPSVDAGIPQVAGDPPSPVEGDIWYNTNAYKLKVRGLNAVPAGSWASGPSMNTTREGRPGGAGTTTAGLIFGGSNPSVPAYTNETESFDGSSYSVVPGTLNNARGYAGPSGTQTAALYFGGQMPGNPGAVTHTESYDGTAWTELNNINQVRNGGGGNGSQTAALFIMGGESPNTQYTNVESWNGTSWTEITDVNTGGTSASSVGTSGAAITFFRHSPNNPAGPYNGRVEDWNGSAWTEVNDLNQGRGSAGVGGVTSTAAIGFGGYRPGGSPDREHTTEAWDGTSWTEVGDMTYGRYTLGSFGTTGSASANGASPATSNTSTEIWNTGVANKNITLTQLTNVIKEFLKVNLHYKQ